jgi:hypothetical protein
MGRIDRPMHLVLDNVEEEVVTRSLAILPLLLTPGLAHRAIQRYVAPDEPSNVVTNCDRIDRSALYCHTTEYDALTGVFDKFTGEQYRGTVQSNFTTRAVKHGCVRVGGVVFRVEVVCWPGKIVLRKTYK